MVKKVDLRKAMESTPEGAERPGRSEFLTTTLAI